MTSDPNSRPASAEEPPASSGGRPLVSWALFVHLFLVCSALSGNLFRSGLQERLLAFFAPYTQLLNFDPNSAPYHLTHGPPDDADARIEVLPAGQKDEDANWIVLPSEGFRGGEARKRYQRLAAVLGYFAGREDTESAAVVARGVASNLWLQDGIVAERVRCRRHLLQEFELPNNPAEQRDPFDESYFREVYRAVVVQMDENRLEVFRLEDAGSMVPPDAPRL